MPIYNYRCQACDRTHEALQSINESPLTTCPYCQAEALKKLPSAPAFTFKGSGWFKDLYSSPPPPQKDANAKADAKPAKKDDKAKKPAAQKQTA